MIPSWLILNSIMLVLSESPLMVLYSSLTVSLFQFFCSVWNNWICRIPALWNQNILTHIEGSSFLELTVDIECGSFVLFQGFFYQFLVFVSVHLNLIQ